MRVMAVVNQKGGVGKSTTVFNTAHALALIGEQVLAVDLDPQAQLTAALGYKEPTGVGVGAVLQQSVELAEAIRPARPALSLLPADPALGQLEQGEGGAERGWLLSDALDSVAGWDRAIIDCPPSATVLVMNALLAADELLIPVAADYLSLEGLSRLMGRIGAVERRLGRTTEKHVLVTRYNGHRRLAREVREALYSHFGERVLDICIREAVALAESPSFGQSIFEYSPHGAGAADYHALAGWLAEREARGRAA